MNKKIVLLLLLLLLVLLAFVFYFVLVLPKQLTNNGGFPTPTPFSGQGTENISFPNTKTVDQGTINSLDRSYRITQLVPKLPYQGKNFSLYYSFRTNQFILYINPSAPSDGNVEFDAFLKQNGVDDRSWIENLTVINKNVTPAP